MWTYTGQERPPFAEPPGQGCESVWDYPRPPRVEGDSRLVQVAAVGLPLAESTRALRVLETASPPTFYLPATDVDLDRLQVARARSVCEWKGAARYWRVKDNDASEPAAWDYPDPTEAFAVLSGHLAFYPGRVICHVDGERVRPQPGGFYAGWVTDEVCGPFKGAPGTGHW